MDLVKVYSLTFSIPVYSIISTILIENACSCNHGMAGYGYQCYQDGAESCTSCESGYSIFVFAVNGAVVNGINVGRICQKNICSCLHGTVDAENCPETGGNICISCEDG